MEKTLQLLPLLKGIDPNLSAGQRAMRVPSEYNSYTTCTIPHNAEFYNFGNGPFTIFIRYMDLGAARPYDQTGLVTKFTTGTGWGLTKQNTVGNITFQIKTGGGIAAYATDNRPALIDGFFHTICVVKNAPAPNQDPYDINLLRMFRDGVEITGNNITRAGTFQNNFDNTNILHLGGFDGYFLRGYIDVCAFYTVGLTDAEIVGLSDSATRTDRGAKFIHDFNQLSGSVAIDSSSIGQNGQISFNARDANGRGWVRINSIKTFARNATLQTPLNGHFTPTELRRITGINRFDSDLTACEFSLDNSLWSSVTFNSDGQSVNFPVLEISPETVNPTLYLRASNANPSFLNAVELIY